MIISYNNVCFEVKKIKLRIIYHSTRSNCFVSSIKHVSTYIIIACISFYDYCTSKSKFIILNKNLICRDFERTNLNVVFNNFIFKYFTRILKFFYEKNIYEYINVL